MFAKNFMAIHPKAVQIFMTKEGDLQKDTTNIAFNITLALFL